MAYFNLDEDDIEIGGLLTSKPLLTKEILW